MFLKHTENYFFYFIPLRKKTLFIVENVFPNIKHNTEVW